MPATATQRPAFATVENFLATVTGQAKTAGDKRGAENVEPGGYDGPTTHPIKNVPDNTQPAQTGARSAENTRDVKEEEGKPSVDATAEAKAKSAGFTSGLHTVAKHLHEYAGKLESEAGSAVHGTEHEAGRAIHGVENEAYKYRKGLEAAGIGAGIAGAGLGIYSHEKKKSAGEGNIVGSAESDQYQIGTRVAPTGEDPSVETASAKSGKKDSGRNGPSTHPARTDNSELNGGKYAQDLQSMPLIKLANHLADLGNEICADLVNQGYQPTGKQAADQSAGAAAAPSAAAQPTQKSAQIDPRLAQQFGWDMAMILTGNLNKQAADAMVIETLTEGIKVGEDDADAVHGYMRQLEAAARQKQADGMNQPDPAGGAGGSGGGDIAAALSGGGGGDPSGGAPPAHHHHGGGDPSGGGGGDDGMAMLQQVMDEMGVTPEELAAALQQEASGGGGMPPGGAPGGAGPTAAAAPMANIAAGPGGGAAGPPPGPAGLEVSASDKNSAATKQAVESFVREAITRSRQRTAAGGR